MAGWYKNNMRHGNWMLMNGNDLSIIERGWYQNDKRISKNMRHIDHAVNNFGAKFTRSNIFNDYDTKINQLRAIVNQKIPLSICDEVPEDK